MKKELETILEQLNEEELDQVLDFEVTLKGDKEVMERVKQNTLTKVNQNLGREKWMNFRKGMAIAASVMIVISGYAFVHIADNRANHLEMEQAAQGTASVITYNNVEYNVLVTEDELKDNNLPLKIEEEMVGSYITTFKSGDEKSELYHYKEDGNEHVLVMKDYNGDYVFLISEE